MDRASTKIGIHYGLSISCSLFVCDSWGILFFVGFVFVFFALQTSTDYSHSSAPGCVLARRLKGSDESVTDRRRTADLINTVAGVSGQRLQGMLSEFPYTP